MIDIQSLTPAKPTHPGEILADELEARGLKQQEFARQIGMQKSQLNEIIKGKRNINAELAILLETTIDVPATYWLNAQQCYDLDLAKQQKRVQERATALELWKSIKNYISVSFLKAQKVISGDPLEDIPIIKRIFHVSTIDELAAKNVTSVYKFRKSDKAQTEPLNLYTWIALVKYKAESQIVTSFDYKSKPQVINSVREIIAKNENVLDNIKQTLNECGIKFVHQEKAEKTPIDGMSFWSEGRPTIAVTLRHHRIDNFAFTLFHELGHVYLHLTNNNEACYIDLEIEKKQESNREEIEADTFAQECLISPADWKFFDQTAEHFNPEHITEYAKKIGTHPAILAGRVCYETQHYNWNKGDIDYAIN
ncbi:HigA family addiction module antitoxin [Siphonobacter sp. SORGH_AS_1065]|uniref:HigA family addiction module antitoxin n=1 Tax=Siphonobacter sp. SORGH_AS_1065 TaxID=3041795 RepID=UPI002783B43A|nr:HigA family addiction module antitoxin [Siphonobacter sp. SORGH_AS_1065]MDQ1086771.1 HTH-type transcriptional regulator/antitoxin HigA [Siphonobacter sp. SORGH_AS_1065]